MNFPVCNSLIAWRSSACVFITIGPYHATGSSSGLPDTSRKRIPSGPACTTISSPRSNNTSEWFPMSYTGSALGFVASSVSTACGAEASRKVVEDKAKLSQVADEMADVACYLLNLSITLGIDLSDAIVAKVAKNAVKYPADKYRGRSS